MRALIDTGMTLDVFAVHPLDQTMWQYAQPLLAPSVLPRDRIHHIGVRDGLRRLPISRRGARFVRDAVAVTAAALRYGPVTLAKTAYVVPKAWSAANRFADQFDHVLAYWGNFAGTCAYLFHRSQNRRVPFSIWLHAGTDLYFKPAYLRQKLEYADTIITCCAFNRSFILDRYAAVADRLAPKTHVCYHGLDLDALPYRPGPEGRPPNRVIAVGRLARDKGFAILLRAVRDLAGRGLPVELEIVGDGPERAGLEQLAHSLGIGPIVTFRGWVKVEEALAAMSRSTVLVHPSDRLGDGLPNVLREAMALGTPVIASRVAGIPEALDDGRCGLLVPPRDVGALADALAALLGDATLQRTLADRARRRTEQLFDMRRTGARLAELLGGSAPSMDGAAPVRADAALSPLAS